jgi:hypothetical protein
MRNVQRECVRHAAHAFALLGYLCIKTDLKMLAPEEI